MTHRNKALNPIKNLLNGSNQVLKQVAQDAVDLKPFQRAWRAILPKPACDHIHPALFRDGQLTVWVYSPVWANWMRHRRAAIISVINDQGLPKVHTLTIKLSQQQSSYRNNPLVDQQRPSKIAGQVVEQTARSIADPELRHSLQRLVRTLKKPR